jgi:Kef-type K+ transport system membrane component KefB
VIPFALGIGLAYYVYNQFAPEEILSFSLFMGIALSITAFPVLARIVQERGIHKTKLGAIVITCAAADDITVYSGSGNCHCKSGDICEFVVYNHACYAVRCSDDLYCKPFLKGLRFIWIKRQHRKPVVAIFFLVLIVSSYATEVIGIHALFGALWLSYYARRSKIQNHIHRKSRGCGLDILLPLFFVFTGLKTEIGLINDPYLWKVTGFIILL